MSGDKTTVLNNLIPSTMFDTCLLDGLSRKEILKRYPTRSDGAYYLDKFINHIKSNNISLIEYCENYLNLTWPKCPISKENVGYKTSGKGIKLSTFKKGKISKELCPEFKRACEKLSKDRIGKNNPMFGKTPWNRGLSSLTDHRMKTVSEKMTGRVVSEETRQKQKIARKNNPIKARHTTPHSKETKDLLRKKTCESWVKGVFNRKTSIEQKVEDFLKTLSLTEPFVFQYQIDYFTVDFSFPTSKIAIECHGSFFHCDPRLYPNGPICAVQRRNFGRDRAKRKWCVDRMGWIVIELWETEINDNTFKDILKCKLLELNLLNL